MIFILWSSFLSCLEDKAHFRSPSLDDSVRKTEGCDYQNQTLLHECESLERQRSHLGS